MKNFKLRRTAAIIGYTVLAVVLFSSCSEQLKYSETYEDGEYKSFSAMLNKCKGTTIVIGIGEMDGSFNNAKISIAVIDSTNTAYCCRIGGNLGLNVGDTVKVSLNNR